jgi:transcriptional antiterminator NusG
MIPENEKSPVEPALNGDEPSTSVEDVSVEPNGSDVQEPATEPPLENEPVTSEEPPAAETLAAAEVAPEPESASERKSEPAESEPDQPAADNSRFVWQPGDIQVTSKDSEAQEERTEPVPSAEPEPVAGSERATTPTEDEVVAAAATEEPAPAEPAASGSESEPAPEIEERAAEEPDAASEEAPAEDASTIADDIQQAIAAAAAAAKASAEAAVRASAEADVEMPAALAEAEPVQEVEADVEGNGAEPAVVRMFQPGDWFVVHTYAGYENKVKANLQSRISSMNMEEKIFEVTIPMEDVMEIKSGKKQVVSRKVFPGYLLVRMDLDDDSWYVVRNTPGVTGFVGSGTKPIPLSEREVDRILQRKAVGERPKPKLEWTIGDPVRVTTGPFANFQGVISEIDTDRSKLKVLVNIFGRETPVELGFDQVAKV